MTVTPRKGGKRVSIRRNVVNLSLPVLLSSLFQRLVSLVDIFLVGGLGAAAIAATGLGQLLIFVVMTVFWGLATGTTVVIAHLWGAGRFREAKQAGITACAACAAMAVAATAAGYFFGDDVARFRAGEMFFPQLPGTYSSCSSFSPSLPGSMFFPPSCTVPVTPAPRWKGYSWSTSCTSCLPILSSMVNGVALPWE